MRTGEIRRAIVLLLVTMVVAGCATMPGAGGAPQAPQVKLERVEVASYFPTRRPRPECRWCWRSSTK